MKDKTIYNEREKPVSLNFSDRLFVKMTYPYLRLVIHACITPPITPFL